MKKKIMRSLLVLFVILTLTVSFAGCQKSNGSQVTSAVEMKNGTVTYPLTVTDDMGNSVTIDKEPQKIVSLSPATTEILFAVDAGNKVVGRTDYDNYPEAALAVPSIGDFNAPNVEKIIALTPDLVLASDFISDDMRQQLEATGAKVLVFSPVSIDGVMNNIITIGEATNANNQASQVVTKMIADRQMIIDAVKTAATQKSVFIDVGDFFSAGPGSMLDSMLTDINAKNIAADAATPWPQLSTEQIITSNPDVYISLYSTPEQIKATPGFDKIAAIKNNQIAYYEFLSPNSDLVQRPGPRIVEGLALLAKDVYPELFSN
ncbi:ABC transporter substrate-binding protein [Acetobacterium wieringae]|nr:ABC transporter substrate-binding protein [Acetobacterium wieringae]